MNETCTETSNSIPMKETVLQWIQNARGRLDGGESISADELDSLEEQIGNSHRKQRLLYLHLVSPNPKSQSVSCTIFEPSTDHKVEISSDNPAPRYKNVIEALADGWQIVQVPDSRAPFDDHEIDLIGYEFILQKTEEFHAQD